MRALRRVLIVAVVMVSGAVSVALAAGPFGPPEPLHPDWRPADLFDEAGPLIGVDGSGNALWATFHRAGGNDQMAVYERCGTTWNRSLLSPPADDFRGVGLRVAPNGTAMAVWGAEGAGGIFTHYSAVRPPGGAWGAPQEIVADATVGSIQFAMSDAGAAIALWGDSAGTWASIRPVGGVWGGPELIVDTARDRAVAMSAAGDAVVVYRASAPGDAWARFRPAGGDWGTPALVLDSTHHDTMLQLMAEFDGNGRAVALARFREFNDAIRVNVRSAGAAGGWGATDQVLDDDGDQTLPNPPPPFDLRNLHALVRHPQGAVAVWTRRATNSNFDDDIVVSRLSGDTWDGPTPFDLPNRFINATVATNAAGEILLAGALNTGSGGGVDAVHATIAPSLTGAWPAIARVSPVATTGKQYRNAVAGGGGQDFYVAWGLHGAGQEGTEIISTKPSGTCGGSPNPNSTPIATASATAEPSPQPLPADPAPAPPAPAPATRASSTPRAIADFTTLPPASTCVKNRKLTLRLKRPPKGYTVKTVTVKVNGRRVATMKGRQLKKPLYLRKLPTGTFTVNIAIKLKKGKGLTERRRYTACK